MCASNADAVSDWIRDYHQVLPPEARPAELEPRYLRAFANYFASYLVSSFDLVEDPYPVWATNNGCRCEVCRYIAGVRHLKPKTVLRNDKRLAQRLQLEVLSTLVPQDARSQDTTPQDAKSRDTTQQDAKSQVSEDELNALMQDPAFARDAALVTYCREILRRCAGEWTGPEALALWRCFAWTSSGPIAGFELCADEILAAEQRLRSTLQARTQ